MSERYWKRGYLDARPLVSLILLELRSMPARILAERLGCTTRTIERLKLQEQMQWQRLDVYAIRLGVHPVEIWGDEWLDAALASR